MKFRSHNGIYQIEIPSSYQHEENNNTLNIYNSNGLGAISITGYRIPSNYNYIIKD